MGAEMPPLPCKFLHFLSLINVNQKAKSTRKIIQIFGCVWQPLGTSKRSPFPFRNKFHRADFALSLQINIGYNFIGHKANRFGSKTIEASKSASIHRWPNNCRKQMRLPSSSLSAFNPCETFQIHIANNAQICSKLINQRRKKDRTKTDKTKCSYDTPIDRPDSR